MMAGSFRILRSAGAGGRKDRFLAALFAPAAQRPALFALYAFNVEIARVRDVAREPMPGEIRLQWWREVVEGRARRGGEGASCRRRAAGNGRAIPPAGPAFSDLIDAHAFDLYDDPMPSLVHAEAYAAKTSSGVFRIGRQDPACALSRGRSRAACRYRLWLRRKLRLFPRHAGAAAALYPAGNSAALWRESGGHLRRRRRRNCAPRLAEMRLHIRGHLAAAA